MDLKKDIERAVRHIAANDYKNPKTDVELQQLIDDAVATFNSGAYNFSGYSSMFLNQGAKTRTIKYYENIYSAENVLCQCVKQILDRTFNIK